MKRIQFRLAASLLLLLLLAPLSAGAGQQAAGEAEATSVLVRLTTSHGTISIGTDDAQASIGNANRAYARFISGQASDQTIGAAEREASKKGDKESAQVGDDALTIAGLLTLGTTGATLTTEVKDTAMSEVEAQLANASALNGLLVFDGVNSRTLARATGTSSSVTRSIHLGGIHALALGDFLAALKVTPLDLTCAALQDVGTLVGRDVASCQTLLDAASAAIDDAIAALQAAKDELIAQRDAVLAALDDAQATLDAITAQIPGLEATLATLEQTRDALTAQRDELLAARSALQTTLDDLEGSRDDLLAQKAALEGTVAGYTRSEVQNDRDTVTSCDGLSGVDALACETNLLLNELVAIADAYGVDIGGLTFDQARAVVLAAIDPILAAFASLDDVTAELATIDAQIDQVSAEIDDLNAQIDDLNAQIDAALADITDVQGQIDALQAQVVSLTNQIAELTAQLEQLVADLATVNASGAADTTCATTKSTLEHVSELLPTLSGTLSPLAAQIAAACTDLAVLLEGLLNIPLINVDGIEMDIEVVARKDNPTVSVTGTLGSVQIGELEPVVVEMPTDSDELAAARALIDTALSEIAAAIGINLPMPELTFLATEEATGKHQNGIWYAEGSVTFLRISFPAATVELPSDEPLGILDGQSSTFTASSGGSSAAGMLGGMFGAPFRAVSTTSATTPEVTLDLATFQAAGSFFPAVADDPNDDPNNDPNLSDDQNDDGDANTGIDTQSGTHGRLPKTGVGLGVIAPMLSLAGAAVIRRFLSRA